MNKLKIAIISVFALLGVATMVPSYVQAAPADQIRGGVNAVGGSDAANTISLGDRIKTIVNVMLYVLGAIAVIMIVIGGIRYTTSNGDSSGITGAKNTILYAIVGLVVAILAYAIVNFVLTSFA